MKMRQQINLYQHLKQTPTFFLTPKVILVFYAIFILFLFTGTTFDLVKNNTLKNDVNILSKELEKQKDYLAKIKSQYPSVNFSDLENSMKRLKEELSIRGEVAAILAHQTRFSEYLTALGNASVRGVWLTEFSITKSGQKIFMKGYALTPSYLQSFLERLRKQSLFKTLDFSLQEISQKHENVKIQPYIEFTISAEPDNSP